MRDKFICIFGQKGNGKTTLARRLRWLLANKEDDPTWRVQGFADPLKDLVCHMFGWDRGLIEANKNNPTPLVNCTMGVRNTLEEIGEVVRRVKPDYFISQALEALAPNGCIFDDGRVRDEAVRSRELGGFNVFIYDPRKINDSTAHTEVWPGRLARWAQAVEIGRIPRDVFDSNAAEDMYYMDVVIRNDKDVDSLHKDADELVEQHITRYLKAQ